MTTRSKPGGQQRAGNDDLVAVKFHEQPGSEWRSGKLCSGKSPVIRQFPRFSITGFTPGETESGSVEELDADPNVVRQADDGHRVSMAPISV
jgi:hypothetical protein